MEPKDLITQIAKALVDNPEQVCVNGIESDNSIVLELTVLKSDMGKVIGKQGRNIEAIRTIMNAIAGKTQKRWRLELIE